MADDPSSLLRIYRPAPGLLMHDWGDSAAVVHVPGTGATHLVDASVAVLLAQWDSQAADARAPSAALEDADTLEAQLPALLQAGILQHRPA